MASDLKLLGSDGILFGVVNDITLSNHDIVIINGKEKLNQDLIKAFSTIRGSHPLFTSYGSTFGDIINKKNTEQFKSDLKEEIAYVVTWVQKQNIDESINIASVDKVDLQSGPNYYDIKISIKLTDGSFLSFKYKQ